MPLSWDDVGTPDAAAPEGGAEDLGAAPPPDVTAHVDALIQQESGGNPNAVGDSGLALGLGQMHPEVRRAYGVRPDSTPEEQKAAVTKYFTELYTKHGGNADDAISEYHLGATNYDRDRNSPENQAYLERYRKRLGGGAATADNTSLSWDDVGTPEAAGGEVDYSTDPRFNTPLTPDEEAQFQTWKQQNAPNDSGADYDLRGAFKAGLQPGANGHWADTYKKPNHPTFSDQSQYASQAPEKAGRWEGETFIPPAAPKSPLGDIPESGQTATSTPTTTVPPPAADTTTSTLPETSTTTTATTTEPPDEPVSKVYENLGKPVHDTIVNFVKGAANISHPSGFADAAKSIAGILGPLGLPAELAGNIVRQAAIESGLDDRHAGWMGTAVSLAAGLATPMPGARGVQTAEKGAAAVLPEARIAEEAATAARGAKTVAEEAAAKVAPSVEASTRARAALNPERPLPSGMEGPPAPPVSVPEAGAKLQAATKGGSSAIKSSVQDSYSSISNAASNLSMPTRIEDATGKLFAEDADALIKNIRNLREQFGGTQVGADAWEGGLIAGQQDATLQAIEDAARTGQQLPYPQMEEFKGMLDSLLPGKVPHGAPPKVARMYQFKWDFRNTMRKVLEEHDPALAKQFDETNARWATEVIPNEKFSDALSKADPRIAFHRVFGSGKGEQTAARVQKALKLAKPEEAKEFAPGMFETLMDKASSAPDVEGVRTLDPTNLLKQWDDIHEAVREGIGNKGATEFFEALRAEQLAATRAAAYAKSAAGVAKQAERTATKAAKAAAAGTGPEGPGKLASFSAHGLSLFLGHKMGAALGHPFLGAMMSHRVIPPQELAKYLANPRIARTLARAIRTPVDSAIVPTIIQQLNKAGMDTSAEKQ